MQKNINYIEENLKEYYPYEEIEGLKNWIFWGLLGWTRTDVLMNSQKRLDKNVSDRVVEIVERLKNNEPIQYILGKTEFAGLELKVEQGVLIPRPETEELVSLIPLKKGARILDVGMGSGCIALGLKQRNNSISVWGCDFSDKALQLARKNAQLTGLNVEFFKCDILKEREVLEGIDLDVIVSNPPYVTKSEQSLMKPNVLNYEPYSALFVADNNALLFYDAISKLGSKKLLNGGDLWFEINEAKGAEVASVMIKYGFEQVRLVKDIFGKTRFVHGKKHFS